MSLSRLEREQVLPLGIEATFAFFADARNLERITPPWLHFQILSDGLDTVGAGSLIDYRLRLHGVPIRWRSEITVWEPPYRFADVQRRGPYRVWVHTHTFEEAGAQGTLVRDNIEYAAPGGPLIDRLFVRKDLDRIFNYRARELMIWAAGAAERPPRPASGSR